VVARLRPAVAGAPLRSLQPLAIRFRVRRPVYPLRLSRMAESGSAARVDLFAPWKLAVEGYGPVLEQQEVPVSARSRPGVFLLFAGPVTARADAALRPISGARSYLTSYRIGVDPDSPDRDPAFVRAGDQRPYRQARVEYDDVYLAGRALPLALALALAGALGWTVRTRGRRRARAG
jgi:hypothetical protein